MRSIVQFNRARLIPGRAAIAALTLGLAAYLAPSPALSAPAASSTSLSSSSNPAGFGESVTFRASVGRSDGGTPTGTVTFKDGAKTLGSGVLKSIGAGRTPAAGSYHSCALTAAGGVQCWGLNLLGALGDGSHTNSPIPIDVIGLASGIAAVAAGQYHTCAVTGPGGVKCWGLNNKGQLGDNSMDESTTPVDVVGLSSGVSAIAAGGEHTCALMESGGVKCWGGNGNGELGIGSSVAKSQTPGDVVGLTSGVADIAANGFYTCALTNAGGVKCWGRNDNGQLGDGTTKNRTASVDVVGLSSGVAAIAAGTAHTCAVTGAGGVKCWGYNNNGGLGDDSTTESHVPVNVMGLASGVAAVVAGTGHTCALTDTGGVKCWGGNTSGQLGDNSTTESHVPVNVNGLAGGVAALANGSDHVCALTDAGGVKCWGFNFYGQLGDNNEPDDSDIPVDVSGLGAGTALVFGGATASTAALSPGNHAVTASYAVNANHTASAAGLTQVVEKGEVEAKIKLKPRKPKAGKTVRIVVKLTAVSPASGNPNGKVAIKDGRKKLGNFKIKNGKAKIKLRDLKAGKYTIKANYPGGKNWENSAAKTKFTAK